MATMLPNLTEAIEVEMIRDGGSYAATFADGDGNRYIMFIGIKMVDRDDTIKETIGYEPSFLIDCDPTKRPPNTHNRMYGELSGPVTAITWTDARALID